MNPSPSASVATWDSFVDDHGVAAAVGTLAAILAVCWVQLEGVATPVIVVSQLMLAFIVLGCVAVLSYRSDG